MKALSKARVRALAALIIALALGACTAFPGGAKLEGGPPPSDGVAFGGAVLPDKPPQRAQTFYIFHIHGMGLTRRKDFHGAMFNGLKGIGYRSTDDITPPWLPAKLAEQVRVDAPGIACETWSDQSDPHAEPGSVEDNCNFPSFGEYRIDTLTNGRDTVHLYTYYWHRDLWRIQEPHLRADMARSRAWLNRKLKNNTVDGGLSDAEAYAGPAGKLVRAGISTVLCRMAQDMTHAASTSGSVQTLTNCSIATAGDFPDLADTEVNFVTHSLGSRMLFDVLAPPGAMWLMKTPVPGSSREEWKPTARGLLVGKTRSVFMAANQLPLLAIGEINLKGEPDSGDPIRGPVGQRSASAECRSTVPLLTARCELRRAISDASRSPIIVHGLPLDQPDDIRVVAFLDPDDLLGFKASDAAGVSPQLTFVDVVHRNAFQTLWFFTNPLIAHDHEFAQPDSRQMILCGATLAKGRHLKARPCPPVISAGK